MKKFLVMLLALCLTLSLLACAEEPAPSQGQTDPAPSGSDQTDPTGDSPVTEPATPENDDPSAENADNATGMTAISITEQTETEYGDNGDPIFEYTYQNIRLLLPDTNLAMTVNLDILNRIDATRANATQILSEARTDSPAYPYSYSVIYTPMRVDSGVLSLFCQQTSYSGGMALHNGNGLTYDLSSGSILTLEDVLQPGVTADTVCPLVIQALSQLPGDYAIYSDYADAVESRFSGNLLEDTGWHLSDEGLCFTFAPYEVAPGSTGFVHALIPYEQLTGILKDDWFPTEQITATGKLEVSRFDIEESARFDLFAEVNLEPSGNNYLLHTDGLIYGVVIETGFRRADDTFVSEKTVFRGSSLLSSEAILLQVTVPDASTALRVTYTGAEGPVEVYLSVDESGNPQLN